MDLPDVLGLTVAEAHRRLGGDCVAEIVTAPPRGPQSVGEWRVVRQRDVDGGVELVTALFPVLGSAKPEIARD